MTLLLALCMGILVFALCIQVQEKNALKTMFRIRKRKKAGESTSEEKRMVIPACSSKR